MKKADLVRKDIIASTLLLAVFLLYGLAGLQYEAGSASSPGPGMFPRLSAMVGGVISLSYLVPALRTRGTPEGGQKLTPQEKKRGILFALSFFLYALLVPILGHIVSVSLFVAFNCWLLGVRKWPQLLALALGAGVMVWLLFGQMLNIQLVRGYFSI